MIRYNEEQLMMKDMFRKFLEKELAPIRDDIELNGVPPYEFIRKLYAHLGLGEMAAAKFHRQIEKEKATELGESIEEKPAVEGFNPKRATATAAQGLLITELAKYGLGIITSLGVSTGLTYSAIMTKGTIAQKEKWALPLATFEKGGNRRQAQD